MSCCKKECDEEIPVDVIKFLVSRVKGYIDETVIAIREDDVDSFAYYVGRTAAWVDMLRAVLDMVDEDEED